MLLCPPRYASSPPTLPQPPSHLLTPLSRPLSVQPAGVAVPPSLRNIFKEIGNENPGFVAPKHGNLISWAQHGVLLLNTSLTVEAAKAGSHAGKGWETLTDKLIALVDKYGGSGEVGKEGEGVVFLAWGAWAGKRVERLDKVGGGAEVAGSGQSGRVRADNHNVSATTDEAPRTQKCCKLSPSGPYSRAYTHLSLLDPRFGHSTPARSQRRAVFSATTTSSSATSG